MKRASLRRRWPEAALIVALAVVAVYAGLVWRPSPSCCSAAWRRSRSAVASATSSAARRSPSGSWSWRSPSPSRSISATSSAARSSGSPRARGPRRSSGPLHIGRLSLRVALGRFVVEDLQIEGRTPSRHAVLHREADPGGLPLVAGRQHQRVLRPFGRDERLDDADREVLARRQPAAALQASSKAPRGRSASRRRSPTSTPTGASSPTSTTAPGRPSPATSTSTCGTRPASTRDRDHHRRHRRRSRTTRRCGPTCARSSRSTARSRLPEIELDTDGAHSHVTGYVDFGHWPEMIYNVDSRVDLWRMREIFFANESWRSRGEARFNGVVPPVRRRPPAQGRLHERARLREHLRVPRPARVARVGAAPLRGDRTRRRGSTTARRSSTTRWRRSRTRGRRSRGGT